MADNIIKVNVTATKKQSVNITAGQVQTPIGATADTSQYYSNLSKNWAVSESIVEGIDYSSKYYANKAKENAENAQNFEISTRENYNVFLEASANAVQEVHTTRDEAIANIETSRVEAVDSINSTKTTILSDIEFVADGEKQEIQNLADEIKDSGDTVNIAIEAGVERLNSIDALKKSQITNCLLEVPQRIKYDLTDGTLTIKAGSVVIVPYGTEDLTAQYPKDATFINDNYKVYDTQFADGKFFVWVELLSDIVSGGTTTDTNERPMFVSFNENYIRVYVNSGSGTTDYTGTAHYALYRTDENIMKQYVSGILQENVFSLPIGRVVADGVHYCGSVTQVFNGMGYIGSTVWVDKGVRALLTNGRNEDGTLNNIDYINDKLVLRNGISVGDRALIFSPYRTGYPITTLRSSELYGAKYDEKTNSYPSYNGAWFATAITDSNGVITSFQPKQPFKAVDYNEIAGLKTYIVDTYVNGTSGYRIWSDKYCEQWGYGAGGNTTLAITLLKPYANTNYSIVTTLQRDTASQIYETYVTSIKTTGFDIISNASGATNANKFWRASGYLA